jgi:hypothetical protein
MGTLREALAAAVSKHEIDVPGDETADEPTEEVEAAPEQEVEQVEAPDEQPAEQDQPAEEELQAQDGRQRDEHGRFKPKPQGEQAPAAEAQRQPQAQRPAAEQPPAQPVVQPTALKAPSSWKPAAREAFAKAPRRGAGGGRSASTSEVQAGDAAGRRRAHNFVEAFGKHGAAVRVADPRGPAGAARTTRSPPATASLGQTAAVLRTGSPQPEDRPGRRDRRPATASASKEALVALDKVLTKKSRRRASARRSCGPPTSGGTGRSCATRASTSCSRSGSRMQECPPRREHARAGRGRRRRVRARSPADFFNDVRRDMAALMEVGHATRASR